MEGAGGEGIAVCHFSISQFCWIACIAILRRAYQSFAIASLASVGAFCINFAEAIVPFIRKALPISDREIGRDGSSLLRDESSWELQV